MDEPLVHAANRPLMTTAFQLAKLLFGLIGILLCLALLLIIPLVWLFTKFWEKRTAAGVLLNSLELMAVYMGIRLYCNVVSRGVWVDQLTQLWIIYMIRFKLRSSYMESKDNFPLCYLGVPCLLLSIAIPLSKEHISVAHPLLTEQFILNRILWALNVYLKAVSVLPQLRVMHNTKIVEPYKAYYVVTLGIVPFITIVNCVLQYIWCMCLFKYAYHKYIRRLASDSQCLLCCIIMNTGPYNILFVLELKVTPPSLKC